MNNGCRGPDSSFTIRANPIPNVSANPMTQTICSGSATSISITNPNNIPGTTFSWTTTVVYGIVSGNTDGSGNSICQNITNLSNIQALIRYSIIPSANGCDGNSINVEITVNPIPDVLANLGSQALCSGSVSSIAITNPNGVTGTSFSWTAILFIGNADGYSDGSGNSITQTLSNAGNVDAVVRYTIIPTANSCPGSHVIVDVTIYPKPDVEANPAFQSICSGTSTTVGLNNPNNVQGTSFTWSATLFSGMAEGFSGGAGDSVSQILTNTTNLASIVRYTVTPMANECPGESVTVDVNVNPIPDMVISPDSQVICSGSATNLSLSNPNNVTGIEYSWTAALINGMAGGFADGSGNLISQTLTNNNLIAVVRYIITPSANDCPGEPDTANVTVKPIPIIVLPAYLSTCSDSVVLDAGPDFISYLWNTGATTQHLTAIQNGTFQVTVSNGGCTASASSNVVLMSTRILNNDTTICEGQTVNLVAGGSPFPCTHSQLPGFLEQGLVGYYPFCGNAHDESGNGSNGTVFGATLVPDRFGNPNSAYSFNGINNYIKASADNLPTAERTIALWLKANSLISGPVQLGYGGGGGCGQSWFMSINHTETPNTFHLEGHCNQNQLDYSYSTPPVNQWVHWAITTSINGTKMYINGIQVANNNTFVSTTQVSGRFLGIGVGSSVNGDVPYTDVNLGYFNGLLDDVMFYNREMSSSEVQQLFTMSSDQYIWSNGAATPGITVTPQQTTTYYVTISHGVYSCVDSGTVTVLPRPVVTASPSFQLVCNDSTTQAIIFTSPVAGTTYAWANSDPSIGLPAAGIGDIPAFSATNPTTAPISASIFVTPTANNCAGPVMTFTITVNPVPSVNPIESVHYCNGVNTLPIVVSGPVAGTVFHWANNNSSIGLADSGTGDIPAFVTTNTGTSIVTATTTITPVANGCEGLPVSFTITVYPTPTVNLVAEQTVCNQSNTIPITLSGPVAGTTFSWTNNDPSIGLPASGNGDIPEFTAANATFVNVTATITVSPSANGCTGTSLPFTFTIYPTPLADQIIHYILCNNVTQPSISFSGPLSGTTFAWVNNNTTIGLLSGGNGDLPAFTTPNSFIVPIVAIITVIPKTNGCTGPGMSFNIIVNPRPIATLSASPLQLCENDSINFTAGGNGGIGSPPVYTYTWSGPNGFSAASNNTTSVLYNVQSVNSGLYSVTVSDGTCLSLVPATVTITVWQRPIATVNPASFTICAGNTINLGGNYQANTGAPPMTAWHWSGPGSFISPLQNPSITNAQPINSGVYYLTITDHNLCKSVNNPGVAVVVNSLPLAVAGSNGPICEGDTLKLTSGPDGNSYSWNGPLTFISALKNPMIINALPTMAGVYTVTVTDGNTCSNTASVTVTIFAKPMPVATITSNPICTGATLNLICLPNNLQGYSWSGPNTFNSGFQNPDILNAPVAASGIYTVTVTNIHNCTNIATVTATVNPLPIADAGPDQTINYGTSASLSGSSSGCNNCVYDWQPLVMLSTSNTITNPVTIHLTANQAYTLVVANPATTCQSLADTVNISVIGSALTLSVTASPDTVCLGSGSQLTVTANGGNLVYTYSWSPVGSLNNSSINNPIAIPSLSTTYTVTVNDGFNSVTSQVQVHVIPVATIDAGGDTTICINNSLLLDQSQVANFSSLAWTSSGDGTFSNASILHPVYFPGANDMTNGTVTITLTATGNTPCGPVSSTFILSISALTTAFAGIDDTICEGNTYTLNLAAATNASSLTWTTSGTGSFSDAHALNPIYNPSPADTIAGFVTLSLHALNSALYCGDSTDFLMLTIISLPIANAGPDVTICFGDQTQLNASGGATYEWSPAAGLSAFNIPDPVASPVITTQYIVTVTQDGCSGSDMILVTVRTLPPVDPGPTTFVCEGDSIRLEVIGGSSYLWSNGASTATIWVKPETTTTYYVTAYDDFGCKNTDSVVVDIRPRPIVEVSPHSASICIDSTVLLSVSGAFTYQWSPSYGLSGTSGSIVLVFPRQTTNYSVTGISQNGCENQSMVTIRVYPSPELRLKDSTYICLGDPYYLNAGYNDSTTYLWQDGSTGQFYFISEPGIYWVTAHNQGCKVTDTIQIDICTSIWIPNSFTPNGDGVNDYFIVQSSTPEQLRQFNLNIYTRWGELIFESDNIGKGWEGKFNGNDCPADVYIYLATWEGQGNISRERKGLKKGTVTLIR
ncbi:MAG: gliding motility-associated C-terminal domain-containing protein [Bacteroidetes bacterium]|nr:gliding motility-associated C-terminal domain-containing protein [Bacteroidota bacterium]